MIETQSGVRRQLLATACNPGIFSAEITPPEFNQESTPAMSEQIVHVSDATFDEEVLNSDKPVMVDYWAEWCGPCKMIAPILDEIADEYEGRLTVAKINIDDNQETPQKYAVRGIPTLMIFKEGQVAGTKVGALSKSQLSAFIDSVI